MSILRVPGLLILGVAAALLLRAPTDAVGESAPAENASGIGFRPDQAAAAREALATWHEQGLDDLLGAEDSASSLQPGESPAALGEATLRAAVIRYAQIEHGQSEGVHFMPDWAIRPSPYDAEGELNAALLQDRLASWLQSLSPPVKAYQDLAAALGHYRRIREEGGWESLAARLPLKQGMSGPLVRALRLRLAREGYGGAAEGDDAVFDPGLTAALAEFQRSHGVTPTGMLDGVTRASLNVPVGQRVDQIKANLERWRWLRRDLPETRVEVNIAAATADLIVKGRPALSMRAIVGRPRDKTPMLEAEIEAVVLNPSWLVPPKIASAEILPKAKRDPDFLSREGFVLLDDSARSGHLRVRQLPGEHNALGQIKFDLPNVFEVYLHDTPARQLFNRDRRTLSHGCVRLEKPLDLAVNLLEKDSNWPPERIAQALAEGATQRIRLAQPMPVFLLYWTAFVDSSGVVNFRDDPYRWDERLLHPREVG